MFRGIRGEGQQGQLVRGSLNFKVKTFVVYTAINRCRGPRGLAIEATLVSVAFSYVFGGLKKSLGTYWAVPK